MRRSATQLKGFTGVGGGGGGGQGEEKWIRRYKEGREPVVREKHVCVIQPS